MKGLDPLAPQSHTGVTDDSGAGRGMKANHMVTNTVRMPVTWPRDVGAAEPNPLSAEATG